jgi:hypothetical protein
MIPRSKTPARRRQYLPGPCATTGFRATIIPPNISYGAGTMSLSAYSGGEDWFTC